MIDEINSIIKELDWSIELPRWEQTPPGYGRPQELINSDVERCDLFIGLLWQLWGTPPSKESRFSSGFEEEFFIARTRREQTQSPEIWIFFKTPSASSVADPGTGLRRVLEFRNSLISEKQILFKDFGGTDSWEKMLRKFLLKHVLSMAPVHNATPEGSLSRTAKPLTFAPPEASDIDAVAAGAQLAMFAHAIEPAFASGDLGLTSASDESTFIAVRGMLLSAALVLASGTSASSIPTHELNTLYRFRDQLRATEPERKILFRAALGDDDSVNPGWYWFKNDQQSAVIELLLDTALFHDQATAVATSFEILRRAGVSGAGSPYNALWILAALEISENVRGSAWGYIVDVATQNDVEVLQEKATGTWLGARVGWLRDWLASGRNVGAFLPKCPDLNLISKPWKLRIIRGISDIAIDSVQALTLSSDSELKAASAEIKSRTFLRTEQPQHSRARRPLTLTSLLSGGLGSPSVDGREQETDEERYERLSREDNSSLNRRLNWYSLDGPPTYELLVERGEISRKVVSIDITDRFNRVRELSDAKNNQVDPELAAAYRREWDQFQDYTVEKFTLGALTALSNNPTVEDVEVARRFLRDRQCADAAIRIVALKGSSSDVSDLFETAGSAYGERQKLAIEGVLRLCSDRVGTVKMFLASKRRELNLAGMLLLAKLTGEEALPILRTCF